MAEHPASVTAWQLRTLPGGALATLCERHGTWSAVVGRRAVRARSLDGVLACASAARR